jgi:hypothetical protein
VRQSPCSRFDLERAIPRIGLPAVADIARSLLAIELPPGSQLSDTEAVTNDIATRLRKRPRCRDVFVDGGRIPAAPSACATPR